MKCYFVSENLRFRKSPHIATFGLVKGNDKSFLVQNMGLMEFKLYV